MNALPDVCHGSLAKSLEQHFSSVMAKEDGLLIVLKKKTVPDRVSVISYEAPVDAAIIRVKPDNVPDKYLIPYGFKYPVWIGQRDKGFRFYPLDQSEYSKGFFIIEQTLSPKGRDEKTGTLLYIDNPSEDHSYEIVDEKHYTITVENGNWTTNIYKQADAAHPSASETLTPHMESVFLDEKPPLQETKREVVKTNSIPVAAVSQKTEEANTYRWKRLFPVAGLLLAATFLFFKFRKR